MFFIVAPMFFFVIGAIQIRDDDDDDDDLDVTAKTLKIAYIHRN